MKYHLIICIHSKGTRGTTLPKNIGQKPNSKLACIFIKYACIYTLNMNWMCAAIFEMMIRKWIPFFFKVTRHSSVKNHWSGTKFEQIRKIIGPELNLDLICIFLTIFAAPLFFYSVLLLFNYICFILSIQNSTGNYCNIKVM